MSILKELLVHNSRRDKLSNSSAGERDAQGKNCGDYGETDLSESSVEIKNQEKIKDCCRCLTTELIEGIALSF